MTIHKRRKCKLSIKIDNFCFLTYLRTDTLHWTNIYNCTSFNSNCFSPIIFFINCVNLTFNKDSISYFFCTGTAAATSGIRFRFPKSNLNGTLYLMVDIVGEFEIKRILYCWSYYNIINLDCIIWDTKTLCLRKINLCFCRTELTAQ